MPKSQQTSRIDKMKKGTHVLLLASYCGGNNVDCTAKLPCINCLKMCNAAILKEDCPVDVLNGYKYMRGFHNV